MNTVYSFSAVIIHCRAPWWCKALHEAIAERYSGLVNPRRACGARVTVLGQCVCLFVCLLLKISFFPVFIRTTNDTNLGGE